MRVETEPKYTIGYEFIPRGRFRYVVTIVDIYKKYNSKKTLIEVEYIGVHLLCGQPITQSYCETSLDMGESVNLSNSAPLKGE